MRTLKYLSAAAALLLLAAVLAAFALLHGSLPVLDGALRSPGLSAPVRISRDALGVPTLAAANRLDLAYATGFVHAQDRFFQMDLSRRLAAGELAELFGQVALPQDQRTRLFRFRLVAGQAFELLSTEERALLTAYARGVNGGLAALAARPWEYWVLGRQPAPWKPEDTFLVEFAMWWDLQSGGMRYEILRQQVNARLGGAECGAGWKCALEFLYPTGSSWDAPVTPSADGERTVDPVIPGPEALDLRERQVTAGATAPLAPPAAGGSNNWAVAGRLTASGAALVANDMHLGLRVPAVWYRARLRLTDTGAGALDLNGVTLPGAPLLVAGSNGHIAWGFTNSYGTWFSVSRVPCTAAGERELTTPGGSVPLTVAREEIRVHGAAPVVLEVKSAAAGVLLRADEAQHSCWFGSWLAQNPAATNLGLLALERAASVEEALALAPSIGIPHQNAVIGDEHGHIAWTIFGRIPVDTGAARAQAVSWTTAADHPRIVDPPSGRIWTANARVASDERALALIGGELARFGAQYNLGARAGQIRDDLLGLHAGITPADMLRVQLDDRALFLARWRALLLGLLDADAVRDRPRRGEFRRLIEDWDARAGVDSVGYRLVRAYHDRLQQSVWASILTALELGGSDAGRAPEQFESALWALVTRQPRHWLPFPYADWPSFLRGELDATLADLQALCPELARCTWGAHNVVRIRHPLSRALPWLAGFLDMPALELPGDHDMPRVQDGTLFAASERFAVSPGHEGEGYLHLPGGQSGHPLSPYYRAGFWEWALGKPLPFLPGPAEHSLTLTPN